MGLPVSPILNPPPNCLPIPPLRVVQHHQLWVSCFIHWTLVIYFTYVIYMFPCYSLKSSHPRSPTESKSLFFISVSLLLSHIWGLVQLFSGFLFYCVAEVSNMEFRALWLLVFANSYLIVDLWWEMVSAVSLPPFWWLFQAASLSEALSPLKISGGCWHTSFLWSYRTHCSCFLMSEWEFLSSQGRNKLYFKFSPN